MAVKLINKQFMHRDSFSIVIQITFHDALDWSFLVVWETLFGFTNTITVCETTMWFHKQ